MTRKQLQLLSIDELRLLQYKYLSKMPTNKADDARIKRAVKLVHQVLEAKQIIPEFHKNRLVPSTEKIFRKAKRKSKQTASNFKKKI